TFSFAEMVNIGLQLAEGLAHAHRHGVVHGDVKPENVLFTEDGRLKIADFGVARIQDDRTVAVDRDISGTVRYMAPERLQGQPPHVQIDVFSLGVVLEEVAAGQAVPEPFRILVSNSTARDRSHRTQTMEELADALRRLETRPTPVCDTPTVL